MKSSAWRRGERKLVVHYHIFKNAGMSIDQLLQQAFPSWEDWSAGAATYLGPAELALHVAGRDVQAISSHTLRPGAPEDYDVFPIILLRHPLDRAYSAYLHERRCRPNTLSCHVARATDFKGYVEWCLDHPKAGGVVIGNYQTIHLGDPHLNGHIYNASAGLAELAAAREVLRSLPVAGVVDRFGSFVSRLRPALQAWQGAVLEMQGTPWENASGEPYGSLDLRLADLQERLGSELYRRFDDANTYDLSLYQFAAHLAGEQERACRPQREDLGIQIAGYLERFPLMLSGGRRR
jgi:hypothetical protein